MNPFLRSAIRNRNELVQGCANLMGLAQGMLADRSLNDSEIHFLRQWLEQNDSVATGWPGNMLLERVKAVLADGIITALEREHLVATLREIIADPDDGTGEVKGKVTTLAFDHVDDLDMIFDNRIFCVTGDFLFGPRERVVSEIERCGGEVTRSVSKKIHYLIVGVMGSEEWKHGSYGTKIVKAMNLKQKGAPIQIVREDVWTSCIMAFDGPR